MDNESNFPYDAGYSNTFQLICRNKNCEEQIEEGVLFLAAISKLPTKTYPFVNWFHEQCFFEVQRPTSVDDIENFNNLKLADQQRIQEKIREYSANIPIDDFGVEHAKSAQSKCRVCNNKIAKQEIRINKMKYDTELARFINGEPCWHHVNCFARSRLELCYFTAGERLPGFINLKPEEQETVKNALPDLENNDDN